MRGRGKLIFKWGIIFAILISYSYYALSDSLPGLALTSATTPTIPVYVDSSAGIEIANSSQILNLLTTHNISLPEKWDKIPIKVCNDTIISDESGKINFKIDKQNNLQNINCTIRATTFYLIEDNGNLIEDRDTEEVRKILNDNPGIINKNDILLGRDKNYWWLSSPIGSISG